MQTASRARPTRLHHNKHMHPSSRHRAQGTHRYRAIKPCEGICRTARGATYATSSRRRRVNRTNSLTHALTHRVNRAKLESARDIENLIDRLIVEISRQQKGLRHHYSYNVVRTAILDKRLRKWRRKTIRSLVKTCPMHILRPLNTTLKNNFRTLVESMEKAPLRTEQAYKTRQAHHKSGIHNAPVFYVEQQENNQCGRHSVNAYYQSPVLKLHNKYEEMDIQDIYNEMVAIEERRRNPQPLVIFRYLLTEVEGHTHQVAYEKPTPTCFDDMPVNKMILTMPSHHVCFMKDDEGDWYLLDSLRKRAKKMKPSEYISRQRVHYSREDILQHCQTEERPNIAVICEDKGQDYPNLDVVNNRPVLSRR